MVETVVVTGANGFIASWIVKLLLERGYNVRGTVRNPSSSRVEHLLALPGAPERLVLFQAELLGDHGAGYDEAVAGADFVVHTAAPVSFADQEIDPYKDVVDPAVQGTLNVLNAAAKTTTVKKVVYTSSTATVFYSDRYLNRTEDDVVDERWWSDPDFCLKGARYYHAGKTLAEQAAWEFAKDAPFKFVSIAPCTVFGGLLQKSVNWSSNEILRILKGVDDNADHRLGIPTNICFVSVEDVAMAHVLALENPNAAGRYLAIERSMNNDQLAVLLGKLFPEYPAVLKPDMKGMDEATFMKPAFQFSNERLKSLGLNFSPVEVYVKQCVESLKQLNLLQAGQLKTSRRKLINFYQKLP